MTNSELNRILRRIRSARKYCKTLLEDEKSTDEQREDAEIFKDTLNNFIDGMCKYTCNVFDDNYKNATRAQMRESFSEVKDYQTKCEEIEKTRKNSHNSLIINIRTVDAMCREFGLEEIYGELPKEYQNDTSGLMGEENRKKPGVVATRHAIADWTFDFVLGCTVGMYMDIGNYNESLDDYREVTENFKYKQRGNYGAKKSILDLTDPDL